MSRALVMGLGSFGGGLGATRFLVDRGHAVTVTDLRGPEELADSLAGLRGLAVDTVLGEHRSEDFELADLVVANPAVRPDHPLLETARRGGARVTSATELFLESVRARVLCVTGTQGKSSTCHALAELLRACGERVHLGGNIGGSLLETLPAIEPEDVVVLELSSYQLEALSDPEALGGAARRVEAVCVTNVLADHLERHGSRAAYAAAKRRVLDLVGEGGAALVPADDPELAAWAPPRGRRIGRSARGPADLSITAGGFRFGDLELGRVDDLALPGAFQRDNVLSALGLAFLVGAEPDALARALPTLTGLAHRLEELAPVHGVRIHDNGVSTTPDSTVAALRSLPAGVQLLIGGRNKDLPLDELLRVAREREARVVTFGEAGPALAAACAAAGVPARPVESVEDAVAEGLRTAPAGSRLLFSPACASFDAYPNFRARALAFRAACDAARTSPEPR